MGPSYSLCVNGHTDCGLGVSLYECLHSKQLIIGAIGREEPGVPAGDPKKENRGCSVKNHSNCFYIIYFCFRITLK